MKDYTFHPENLIKGILLTVLLVAIVAAIVIVGVIGKTAANPIEGKWEYTEEGWATQTVEFTEGGAVKITLAYTDEALTMLEEYGYTDVEECYEYEGTYSFTETEHDGADTGDVETVENELLHGTLIIEIDESTDEIEISVGAEQMCWDQYQTFTRVK